MGLNLKLLPSYEIKVGEEFSVDVLTMERDDKLFQLISDIENLKGIQVTEGGINSYVGLDEDGPWEEYCYSKTELTAYGGPMKSLLASELQELFTTYQTNIYRNKAVFAYIKELPKELPVYLYWC